MMDKLEKNYHTIQNIMLFTSVSMFFSVVLVIILYPFWNRSHYLFFPIFISIMIEYLIYTFFFKNKIREIRKNRWFKFNIRWMPLYEVYPIGFSLILTSLFLDLYFISIGWYPLLLNCGIVMSFGLILILMYGYNHYLANKNRYGSYLILLNQGDLEKRLKDEFERFRIADPKTAFLNPSHDVNGSSVRIFYSMITIFIIVGGDPVDRKKIKAKISELDQR